MLTAFHALIIRIARSKVKSRAQLGVIALVLLTGFRCDVQAAFEGEHAGPRGTALGGGGVALSDDPWSMNRNPALTSGSGGEVGIEWSQLFGLPELTRKSAVVRLETRGQPWATYVSSLGSDLYRESQIRITAGRQLGAVSAGLAIDGQWLYIKDYRRGNTVSLTAGLLIEPERDVTIGAVWRNLNHPQLHGYADRIEETLTVGAAVRVMDEGVLIFDIVQEARFSAEYRFGAEAQVLKNLALRVGARAEPVRPSAGIGFEVGRYRFYYAGDLHPDLGASHEIGLGIRFAQ
jgi:hypothetical protein